MRKLLIGILLACLALPALAEEPTWFDAQYAELVPYGAEAARTERTYAFPLADGRTAESEGLSLYDLAQFLKTLGATTAYNLDGGGSSAMIYQGQLVNHPTSTGRRSNERSVSDIVAIF